MIRKLIQYITGRFYCWNDREPGDDQKCPYQCDMCREMTKAVPDA